MLQYIVLAFMLSAGAFFYKGHNRDSQPTTFTCWDPNPSTLLAKKTSPSPSWHHQLLTSTCMLRTTSSLDPPPAPRSSAPLPPAFPCPPSPPFVPSLLDRRKGNRSLLPLSSPPAGLPPTAAPMATAGSNLDAAGGAKGLRVLPSVAEAAAVPATPPPPPPPATTAATTLAAEIRSPAKSGAPECTLPAAEPAPAAAALLVWAVAAAALAAAVAVAVAVAVVLGL